MRSNSLIGWCVVGMLISGYGGPAKAQEQTPGAAKRFELTPFGGFTFGGSLEDEDSNQDLDFDDGDILGLIFNIREKYNTQYEFLFAIDDAAAKTSDLDDITSDVDLDNEYYQLGGTYLFDSESLTEPFIAATIGLSRFKPDGDDFDDENFFSWSLGGGVKILPTERFGIRLEARSFGSWVDGDTDLFCRSVNGVTRCAISASGDIVWRWHFTAGAVFRF